MDYTLSIFPMHTRNTLHCQQSRDAFLVMLLVMSESMGGSSLEEERLLGVPETWNLVSNGVDLQRSRQFLTY